MFAEKELELEYIKDVREMKEEIDVSYITSFEYFGRLEGIREGESNVLLSLLETKFGIVPETYLDKVKAANSDILLTWSKKLLSAKSLEEIFNA